MHDVFRAGVDFGGLTADYELKILICYLLDQVKKPMPVAALIEVFVAEAIGNYFEAASAAASLVTSGNIAIETLDGEKCYSITPTGSKTAAELAGDLPAAIRQRSLEAAERFFVMRERRAHNSVSRKRVSDGFLLTLTIHDIGSDLLQLTILLPDEATCKELEQRFLSDPIVVYKGVVALLIGSFDNVGALIEP